LLSYNKAKPVSQDNTKCRPACPLLSIYPDNFFSFTRVDEHEIRSSVRCPCASVEFWITSSKCFNVYAQRLAGKNVANVRIFHSKYPALRMCIAINAHSKTKYSELDSRSSILAGYCDSVFTTSSMKMRIMKPLCDRYRVQAYSGLPKYRLLQHTVSRQSYTFFYLQHSCYNTCFGPK